MSRERNEEKKGLSPTQRKACVVLALCALAIVLSIVVAWVLPGKLGLFNGGASAYDKDAYPLDTSLEAILPQAAADDAYITASVFAGDQYAVTLQKDARITGSRGLSIFVFNVQQIRGKTLTKHSESLDYLKSLGLPVSPRYHVVHDIEDAIAEIENIGQNRSKLDFDMDGAVIKVNDFAQRELMGSTNKFPRWAIAFKYPPEVKETTLRSIEVAVGDAIEAGAVLATLN